MKNYSIPKPFLRNGIYYVRIALKGQSPQRLNTGQRDYDKAVIAAKQMYDDAYNRAFDPAYRKHITLEDAFALTVASAPKPATVRAYTDSMNKLLGRASKHSKAKHHFQPTTLLHTISNSDVARLIRHRRQEGYAEASIRLEVGFIITTNNYLTDTYLTNNSLKNDVGYADTRDRIFTDAEISLIRNELRTSNRESKQTAALLFDLYLATGARRGEIADARWDQFNFQAGQMLLKLSKTSTQSVIPIPSNLMSSLQQMQQEGQQRPFKPYHVAVLLDVIDALCNTPETPRLSRASIHTCRHTFCSRAANSASVPQAHIRHYTGHTSAKMLDRYIKTTGQDFAALQQAVSI